MASNSKTVTGARGANGRSIFFLQSFVKSRPIETRTSETVPFQIVSLKKPKMSSHIGMWGIAR